MSSKVLIWATSSNKLRLKHILSSKACAFVKIHWKELKSLTWTSGALIGEGLLDILKPCCWTRGTSPSVEESWILEVNPEDHPELFWEPTLWFPAWGVELKISSPWYGWGLLVIEYSWPLGWGTTGTWRIGTTSRRGTRGTWSRGNRGETVAGWNLEAASGGEFPVLRSQ